MLLPDPLFDLWPDLYSPLLHGHRVGLNGFHQRHLRRPPQFLQQPFNLPRAIPDTEFLGQNLAHARPCPHLTTKAISLRTVPEKVRDQLLLLLSQFRGTTKMWRGAKSLMALTARVRYPLADHGFTYVQHKGNVPLAQPQVLAQLQCSPPTPFVK